MSIKIVTDYKSVVALAGSALAFYCTVKLSQSDLKEVLVTAINTFGEWSKTKKD